MQIDFERRELSNGMKILVHQDSSTTLVAFNILYNVGSKHEKEERTGMAHLLEHLMFEGSKNFRNFDTILERVGGENNAFTNNDFTNYYITLPKEFLEIAFQLESDRMQDLILTPKRLEVQKNVVIEEFKQTTLNKPYGDVGRIMREMVYKTHPYRWSTIGRKIAHIRDAGLKEVKEFYRRHYQPSQSILAVVGNVEAEEVFELAEKYFGDKKNVPTGFPALPQEKRQLRPRRKEVYRDVPAHAIYKTYHITERMTDDFYVFDLISDILSNGKSSRFNVELVKKQSLFTSLDAFVSGDIDKGTFMINGSLRDGVSFEQAEKAIENELQKMMEEKVSDYELQKVKNRLETVLYFSNIKAIDKAMNLAYFELMGQAENLNMEVEKYRSVTAESIQRCCREYLTASNCSTLYYHAKEK